MHKTAIVTDRSYTKHFAGRSHPERPERIEVMIRMAESLKRDQLSFRAPRAASLEEIALCHLPEYIAAVERTSHLDRFDFDPDTHTSRDSYQTALLAAGGVLTAVETVLDGAADNAFALVRPPGHHALPNRAMGFCFFNSVAIASEWLVRNKGLQRVMVIDWDLHHGNGTQEIFYDSAEVLYASTHQFPHYPDLSSVAEDDLSIFHLHKSDPYPVRLHHVESQKFCADSGDKHQHQYNPGSLIQPVHSYLLHPYTPIRRCHE